MVNKPKKLKVNNLPFSTIEIPNHPVNDIGKRVIEIDENILICGDDAQNITEGTQVRLLGLGNVQIQWVPQKTAHEIKLLVPNQLFIDEQFNENSLEELEVYTEPHYLKLKEGEEIQFVRFGYCRKDSQNQAIFTHK